MEFNKENVTDLAIFGGTQLFDEPLNVGTPNIGNRDKFIERMNGILDRRWLTNRGPLVSEFENLIASYVGVKHCIAMCNGMIALEVAIRALEMKGEVIVPSFTFIATAHALQWQEVTPIFCDIDRHSHNIDPAKIERLITPRTTGIIGVHLWGRPCDIDALIDIAKRHKLKLLFDAAHGIGATYQGRMIGSFGDAEVFSFHGTKILNSFEGGAVLTNNDELAAKIRFMKNFGFAGFDDVAYIGTNGKMCESSAAMGITSLESLQKFIEVNRKNYYTYKNELEKTPGLKMVLSDENQKNNFQYIIFEIEEDITGISRDLLVKLLQAERIIARRYFYPGCHRMQPYRSFFPNVGYLLAETERLTNRVFALPTGTAVDENQIKKICRLIQFILSHSREIQEKKSLDTL